MNDEEVIVEDYKVIERTVIATEGFFLAEYVGNGTNEKYASGTIDRSKLDFGFEQYQFRYLSDDYLDVVKFYHQNIISKIEQFKEMSADIPKGLITREHCNPLDSVPTLAGEIVVQSVDVLFPEYRNASNQIYLATAGNGCRGDARGSAVYAVNLYSGERTRLERYDLIGILRKEHIPNWAKKTYETIRSQKNKEKER